ncbi:hypothetical protein Glove_30g17 [Diversispora epigaea]|uniref:HIG1 domain-containing protein n=1 Tax=Diversispora epigaea TaxID=1348612 RepID=A0A397JKF4_9GLOM|nr:hypothetical protein Glove_30g17 [Diversispora epigaea]
MYVSQFINDYHYQDNNVFVKIMNMTQDEEKKTSNRFIHKLKSEPLVTLGLILTASALLGATYGYQRGDSATMQKFMRYRIAAQGFTVLAAMSIPISYQVQSFLDKKKEEK